MLINKIIKEITCQAIRKRWTLRYYACFSR